LAVKHPSELQLQGSGLRARGLFLRPSRQLVLIRVVKLDRLFVELACHGSQDQADTLVDLAVC
jgi:hypothetical protein